MTATTTATKKTQNKIKNTIKNLKKNFNITKLNLRGIHYKTSDGEQIEWYYYDKLVVTMGSSELWFWSTSQLIILSRIFKADPNLQVNGNIVESKYGNFELSNPFRCDMITPSLSVIEDIEGKTQPNEQTHWFSKEGAIPYEDLTNDHLANIVYQQVRCNGEVPAKIKEEVLSRFRYELVGNKFVKELCCQEGLRYYMSIRTLWGKPLAERTVLNMYELFNLFDKERNMDFRLWIAFIIKQAIKFYDRFYKD